MSGLVNTFHKFEKKIRQVCFAAFHATPITVLFGNLYRRTVIRAVFRVHMYDYHCAANIDYYGLGVRSSKSFT